MRMTSGPEVGSATLAHLIESPPLESGDRLTRAAFHRRYCDRPEIKKAELVEGVVYVASPVRFAAHAQPHGCVIVWLGTYQTSHPDVYLGDNATVLLDADNELQPDAILWRESPGGPHRNAEDYVEGAPQLVFEVAASSVSYDLHDKLRAYRRNGVLEYIVWRVLDRAIDWFALTDGEFVQVQPDAQGLIDSQAFPGLRLNIERMLANDMTAVLEALRLGR